MLLNLRNVINIPGSHAEFDYELDLSDMDFPGVSGFSSPVHAVGQVKNTAGILDLTADITADAVCVCSRCCKEFPRHFELHTEAVLADEVQDEYTSDVFLLQGDDADLDEIVTTAFVLSLDQRILCKPDCLGLCEKCGADLNDGPCSCKKEIDPRLASLGKLLEE
jgi:uncharacterized protein